MGRFIVGFILGIWIGVGIMSCIAVLNAEEDDLVRPDEEAEGE